MLHFTFHHTIKTSRRARNLRISIKPNGDVIVTKPWLVPKIVAEQFLKKHEVWVLEKLKQVNIKSDVPKILYKGVVYTIDYSIGKFKVLYGKNNAQLSGPTLELAMHTLEDHLRKEGTYTIRKTVPLIAEKMNTSYNSIRIKDQDTRWGSCSTKGNLNFSWRLIKAPTSVLEYVIIHELAHISHMDHSQEFWSLVEKYDPLYREHRRWLRRNQEQMK